MPVYIKNNCTVDKIFKRLIISIIPLLLFAFYKNGIYLYINKIISIKELLFYVLNIIVCILASVITESLYGYINKKKDVYYKKTYNIIPSILLSLSLPINVNILLVILSSVITTLIKIYMSNYKINPILIGLLILNIFNINNTIFNIDINNTLDIIFVILFIITFIYLAITRTIKYKITISYFLFLFIITYVIGNYFNYSLMHIVESVLNGSILFLSIYVITYTYKTPTTTIGCVLYSLFGAIITVLLRMFNYNGIIISFIIMSLFTAVFDKIGSKSRFNFKYAFKPFLLAWIVTILLCICIYLVRV